MNVRVHVLHFLHALLVELVKTGICVVLHYVLNLITPT